MEESTGGAGGAVADPGSTSLWQQTIISPSHFSSSFLFARLGCRPFHKQNAVHNIKSDPRSGQGWGLEEDWVWGQSRIYCREKPWLLCNLRGRDGCGVEEGRVWELGGVRCLRTRTFCFPIEYNPRCAPLSYFRRLDDTTRTTSLRISSAPRSFDVE